MAGRAKNRFGRDTHWLHTVVATAEAARSARKTLDGTGSSPRWLATAGRRAGRFWLYVAPPVIAAIRDRNAAAGESRLIKIGSCGGPLCSEAVRRRRTCSSEHRDSCRAGTSACSSVSIRSAQQLLWGERLLQHGESAGLLFRTIGLEGQAHINRTGSPRRATTAETARSKPSISGMITSVGRRSTCRSESKISIASSAFWAE